jgi:hypothetical protein
LWSSVRTSPYAVLNVVVDPFDRMPVVKLVPAITGTNSIPPEVERSVIARYAETVCRSPFASMTVN